MTGESKRSLKLKPGGKEKKEGEIGEGEMGMEGGLSDLNFDSSL